MKNENRSKEEIFKGLREEFMVLDGEVILIYIMYYYCQKLYSGDKKIESITFDKFPYFFSRFNDILIRSLHLSWPRISEYNKNGENLTIDYFAKELEEIANKDGENDVEFKEKVKNLNCIYKEIQNFVFKPELAKERNKFISHIDRKEWMEAWRSGEERSPLFDDEGSGKKIVENIEKFMRNLAIILTEGEEAIVDPPARNIIEEEFDKFIGTLEQGVKYIDYAHNNSISLDGSTIEEDLLKSGKKIVDIAD